MNNLYNCFKPILLPMKFYKTREHTITMWSYNNSEEPAPNYIAPHSSDAPHFPTPSIPATRNNWYLDPGAINLPKALSTPIERDKTYQCIKCFHNE